MFRYIIVGLLLICARAQAQYLHPEYHTLTEDSVKYFYDPSDIEMEYESDFYHFMPNLKQLGAYYSTQNSFFGSVGSLGKKNFMIRQGAKFQAPLGESAAFRFVQFADEEFENQHSGVIFEFLFFSENKKHALSLFGEAAYIKGEDDLGIAYEYYTNLGKHRISLLASDYSRNKRGVGTDEHIDRPVTLGYLWEKFTGTGFRRLNITFQNEAEWNFPDLSERYISQSKRIQWLSRKQKGAGVYLNTTVFVEKLEQSLATVSDRKRNVYRISRSREVGNKEFGLWYAHHNFSRDDERLKFNFFQPFLWWSKSDLSEKLRWRLGLSSVIGDTDGRLNGVDSEYSGDEHRLSLALEKKSIEIYFSFDLDRIAQSDMWEGGNVKVLAEF